MPRHHAGRRWIAPVALAALVVAGAASCVDDDEPTLVDPAEETGGAGCESGPELAASDAPEVTVPDEPAPDELVVEDIEVGEGHEVAAGDEVSLQYTGVLYDTGETFDSSWETMTPLPFTVGEGAVIPGFDQGVVGMQPGGRRQITIPPDLGYGDEGTGGVIPPGATLVFVVDLVEVCS